MVYSVTPNPALDLGGLVDHLVANEKNYVHSETRAPGGNAINAARIMTRLGVRVTATGFLGGGIGRELEDLLKKEGVKCRFIKIDGDTRVSLTVTSRVTDSQTRLSFPGPLILKSELERLSQLVASFTHRDLILIGGSLPPGVTPQYLTKVVRSLHSRGVPCIVDMPGAILSDVIAAKPFLIKPNLLEFQELVGRKVTSTAAVLKAARELNSHVPLICISSVNGGALLVSQTGAWFGRAPKVKVRTTVGAGDSMVGAMAASLSRYKQPIITSDRYRVFSGTDVSDLLRWGLAAAAATLETHGTELGRAKQIRSFYRRVKIVPV
jgi:1-phosphofructokinase family hexose kinase